MSIVMPNPAIFGLSPFRRKKENQGWFLVSQNTANRDAYIEALKQEIKLVNEEV